MAAVARCRYACACFLMFVFGNVLAMPCRGLIRSGVELVNRLASVQPQCRSIRERERESKPHGPLEHPALCSSFCSGGGRANQRNQSSRTKRFFDLGYRQRPGCTTGFRVSAEEENPSYVLTRRRMSTDCTETKSLQVTSCWRCWTTMCFGCSFLLRSTWKAPKAVGNEAGIAGPQLGDPRAQV